MYEDNRLIFRDATGRTLYEGKEKDLNSIVKLGRKQDIQFPIDVYSQGSTDDQPYLIAKVLACNRVQYFDCRPEPWVCSLSGQVVAVKDIYKEPTTFITHTNYKRRKKK